MTFTFNTPTARFFGRPRTRQRRASLPSPNVSTTSRSLTVACVALVSTGALGTTAAGSGGGLFCATLLAAKEQASSVRTEAIKVLAAKEGSSLETPLCAGCGSMTCIVGSVF